MKTFMTGICIATSLALAPMASAAAYLKIGDIKGESTDSKHSDWIEIESATEALSRPTPAGAGSTRMRASATTEGITIAKVLDKASPKLREHLLLGTVAKDAEIHFTRDGMREADPYLTIKLTNAVITDLQAELTGEGGMEEVTLNYEKIEWTYVQTDRSGKAVGKVPASWDFKAGVK